MASLCFLSTPLSCEAFPTSSAPLKTNKTVSVSDRTDQIGISEQAFNSPDNSPGYFSKERTSSVAKVFNDTVKFKPHRGQSNLLLSRDQKEPTESEQHWSADLHGREDPEGKSRKVTWNKSEVTRNKVVQEESNSFFGDFAGSEDKGDLFLSRQSGISSRYNQAKLAGLFGQPGKVGYDKEASNQTMTHRENKAGKNCSQNSCNHYRDNVIPSSTKNEQQSLLKTSIADKVVLLTGKPENQLESSLKWAKRKKRENIDLPFGNASGKQWLQRDRAGVYFTHAANNLRGHKRRCFHFNYLFSPKASEFSTDNGTDLLQGRSAHLNRQNSNPSFTARTDVPLGNKWAYQSAWQKETPHDIFVPFWKHLRESQRPNFSFAQLNNNPNILPPHGMPLETIPHSPVSPKLSPPEELEPKITQYTGHKSLFRQNLYPGRKPEPRLPDLSTSPKQFVSTQEKNSHKADQLLESSSELLLSGVQAIGSFLGKSRRRRSADYLAFSSDEETLNDHAVFPPASLLNIIPETTTPPHPGEAQEQVVAGQQHLWGSQDYIDIESDGDSFVAYGGELDVSGRASAAAAETEGGEIVATTSGRFVILALLAVILLCLVITALSLRCYTKLQKRKHEREVEKKTANTLQSLGTDAARRKNGNHGDAFHANSKPSTRQNTSPGGIYSTKTEPAMNEMEKTSLIRQHSVDQTLLNKPVVPAASKCDSTFCTAAAPTKRNSACSQLRTGSNDNVLNVSNECSLRKTPSFSLDNSTSANCSAAHSNQLELLRRASLLSQSSRRRGSYMFVHKDSLSSLNMLGIQNTFQNPGQNFSLSPASAVSSSMYNGVQTSSCATDNCSNVSFHLGTTSPSPLPSSSYLVKPPIMTSATVNSDFNRTTTPIAMSTLTAPTIFEISCSNPDLTDADNSRSTPKPTLIYQPEPSNPESTIPEENSKGHPDNNICLALPGVETQLKRSTSAYKSGPASKRRDSSSRRSSGGSWKSEGKTCLTPTQQRHLRNRYAANYYSSNCLEISQNSLYTSQYRDQIYPVHKTQMYGYRKQRQKIRMGTCVCQTCIRFMKLEYSTILDQQVYNKVVNVPYLLYRIDSPFFHTYSSLKPINLSGILLNGEDTSCGGYQSTASAFYPHRHRIKSRQDPLRRLCRNQLTGLQSIQSTSI